jgi:hypothetical protein
MKYTETKPVVAAGIGDFHLCLHIFTVTLPQIRPEGLYSPRAAIYHQGREVIGCDENTRTLTILRAGTVPSRLDLLLTVG